MSNMLVTFEHVIDTNPSEQLGINYLQFIFEQRLFSQSSLTILFSSSPKRDNFSTRKPYFCYLLILSKDMVSETTSRQNTIVDIRQKPGGVLVLLLSVPRLQNLWGGLKSEKLKQYDYEMKYVFRSNKGVLFIKNQKAILGLD